MLHIRPAGLKDIPLIRELTFKIWPQTYASILSEAQIAYMLDMMYSPATLERQMDKEQSFIVCFDDAEPLGFAAYQSLDGAVFKLHKLYILPGKQGQGIGKFIMTYIQNDIRQKGAVLLDVNVNIYNLQAKAFYEKNGFVVVRKEDIDIGSGYFMNDYGLQLRID